MKLLTFNVYGGVHLSESNGVEIQNIGVPQNSVTQS
jgi:hypothetical protein